MTTRATRRILFFVLVFLFLATTPVVVLYSFGYRYSLDRGIFVHSGSISLKTNPQGVDILVDNQPVPKKRISFINNFTQINGIRPGNHTIEVSAPEYNIWKKKLVVKSGISTEFWNVFLTRKSYDRETFPASGADRFFMSPKNGHLAVVRNNDSTLTISLITIADKTDTPLMTTNEYRFTSDDQENIEWTPQATKIIVPLEKDREKHYFIIDVKTGETIHLNEKIELGNISHVRWDPKEKDALYFMVNDVLYRYSISDGTAPQMLIEHISNYDLSPDGLYFFKLPEGIVYRSAFDSTDSMTQITLSSPDDMHDPSYRIVVYDDHRIWMLNNSRELYVYNEGAEATHFQKLADGVVGAQFSNDGKKLLYWTEKEIYVYYVREWETQPIRQENEVQNVTRFSQKITNVQWLQDYEHVVFSVGPIIKLVELDNRDYPQLIDVTTLSIPNARIFNNYSQSELYFTDKDVENPKTTNLYSIIFYEKTGFFGLAN